MMSIQPRSAVLLASLVLAMGACSSSGSTGSGSASHGDGGSSGSSTGGASSGGTSSGGSGSTGGAQATGGKTGTGGSTATGGSPATGGEPMGGAAGSDNTGGAASGGSASTGGADTGGSSTGGVASGGGSTGGAASGGSNTGGAASGGSNTGGAASGGSGGTPSCDDSNPSTKDAYSPTLGCAHTKPSPIAGLGDLTTFDDYLGLYVDAKTGLAWFFRNTEWDYDTSVLVCEALEFGNLKDFRLPTISEVRGLLATGCPHTAFDGTCPLSDPDHLAQADGTGSPACDSCVWNSSGYRRPDVPRGVGYTSSICTDCGGQKDWRYNDGNGNYYATDHTTGTTFLTCVMSAAATGLP